MGINFFYLRNAKIDSISNKSYCLIFSIGEVNF
jgi:hypothetical protein